MSLMNRLVVRNNFFIKECSKALCSSNKVIFFDPNRKVHQYNYNYNDSYTNDSKWKAVSAAIGVSAIFYYMFKENVVELKDNVNSKNHILSSPDKIVIGLPTYGYEEVAKHSTRESRIWVTYKNGVYDITSFISKHPGGNQILEAAGGAIEPFWDLYQQHNNKEVEDMMEIYRIGNYKDVRAPDDGNNIWDNQPKRDPKLIVRSERPFNAETPKELLGKSFITPNHLFYVRHHLPVPEVDMKSYCLTVSSEDGTSKTLKLTLDDLKKFPKHTVTAALMCAGNRRSNMNEYQSTKGLSWGPGAVGNAVWSGAKLKDVLEAAGVKLDEYKHVQFDGMDLDATGKPYGASIPLSTAMDERCDVILAYEMNNNPIPRDHGFPVRVFIPGTVGARCVKWLTSIKISSEESLSHWQRQDYKGFNPSVDPTANDYSKSTSIQHLPVMSAILSPCDGDSVAPDEGYVEVKGYAWSGNGQKIIRIDLTSDQGKSWIDGAIIQQEKAPYGRHWSWTFWSAKIPVKKGLKELEIWVKAVDSNYNTQPENVRNIWNARGVLNNSIDKIKLKIK